MKRKILMMLMTFAMSAAMLAGCSKDDTEKDRVDTEETGRTEDGNETSEDTAFDEKTLSDYFAEPGVQEQMDADIAAAKENYASTYSDIRREVDGNTLVYIYVYKDPIPEDSLEEFQESIDASLSQTITDQNLIGIMEQQSGVSGISLQYIYYNPDGTEIFNKTYSE